MRLRETRQRAALRQALAAGLEVIRRTTSTFSRDIAYSRSPAALRASCLFRMGSIRTIFPRRKVNSIKTGCSISNPACLALAVLDRVGHDRVTYRLEISCFDRVGLPVVKEATHVLPDSVSTDGLDGLREGMSNHEDHVGVEIGETRAEVAGGPAVEDPTNTVP
jgi:hypothetical protein